MSSTYGENLKLSIFGQSHGAAIGMTMDGIPAGLPVDTDALQVFLNRRAPGQNDWSTPRKEADRPESVIAGKQDGTRIAHPSRIDIRGSVEESHHEWGEGLPGTLAQPFRLLPLFKNKDIPFLERTGESLG